MKTINQAEPQREFAVKCYNCKCNIIVEEADIKIKINYSGVREFRYNCIICNEQYTVNNWICTKQQIDRIRNNDLNCNPFQSLYRLFKMFMTWRPFVRKNYDDLDKLLEDKGGFSKAQLKIVKGLDEHKK